MCAVVERALDCGQNFTFTLAEKILQVIVIENRTGRLAKESKKKKWTGCVSNFIC